MAKRLSKMCVKLDINPVNGTYEIRDCIYHIDDDTISGIFYTDINGPNPVPGRAVTGGELSGTLQSFLDGLQSNIQSQEGII